MSFIARMYSNFTVLKSIKMLQLRPLLLRINPKRRILVLNLNKKKPGAEAKWKKTKNENKFTMNTGPRWKPQKLNQIEINSKSINIIHS